MASRFGQRRAGRHQYSGNTVTFYLKYEYMNQKLVYVGKTNNPFTLAVTSPPPSFSLMFLLSPCFLSTTDSYLLRDPSPNPLDEVSHSASWSADREEHREQGDSLRVGKSEVTKIDCNWGIKLNFCIVGATKRDG